MLRILTTPEELPDVSDVAVITSNLCQFQMVKFIHLAIIEIVGLLYISRKIGVSHRNMNITDSESPMTILAKTCGCKEKEIKVTYFFIDSCHTLCLDKRDIIFAQIEACNRLSRYTRDEKDKKAIEREIAELKMSLDLIN